MRKCWPLLILGLLLSCDSSHTQLSSDSADRDSLEKKFQAKEVKLAQFSAECREAGIDTKKAGYGFDLELNVPAQLPLDSIPNSDGLEINLILNGKTLTLENLEHLCNTRVFGVMTFNDCTLPSSAIAVLSKSSKLYELVFSHCKLLDRVISKPVGNHKLYELTLDNCDAEFARQTLVVIGSVQTMHIFMPLDFELDMSAISEKSRKLHIVGCKFDWTKKLKNRDIYEVLIGNTQLHGEDINRLLRLPELSSLDLYYIDISDIELTKIDPSLNTRPLRACDLRLRKAIESRKTPIEDGPNPKR